MTTRDAILTKALELFAARGYDAVGVQEVVEAAGVTKPTLYHYFGSKSGLLDALLDAYHEPLNQAVRAAAAYNHDLTGTLRNLAQAYFDFARRYPVYYRLMLAMVFAPQHSEAYAAVIDRNREQHEIILAMFETAVHDHGNMRGRQRIYAATFIGLLNTAIGLWLNGYVDLDEGFTRQLLHQFEHGIYS